MYTLGGIPPEYMQQKADLGIIFLQQGSSIHSGKLNIVNGGTPISLLFSVERRGRDDEEIDLEIRKMKVELYFMTQYPYWSIKYKVVE